MDTTHILIGLGGQSSATPWWVQLIVPAAGVVTAIGSTLIAYRAFRVAQATAADTHRDRMIARRDQISDAMGDTLKLHAAADRVKQMLHATDPASYDKIRTSAAFELDDLRAKPHWPANAFLGQVEARRLLQGYEFGAIDPDAFTRIEIILSALDTDCIDLKAQVDAMSEAIAKEDARDDKRPPRRTGRTSMAELESRREVHNGGYAL